MRSSGHCTCEVVDYCVGTGCCRFRNGHRAIRCEREPGALSNTVRRRQIGARAARWLSTTVTDPIITSPTIEHDLVMHYLDMWVVPWELGLSKARDASGDLKTLACQLNPHRSETDGGDPHVELWISDGSAVRRYAGWTHLDRTKHSSHYKGRTLTISQDVRAGHDASPT